ncbi:MAG: SHOCT domain-containing protein [Acholeplasmataceae bacterium]|nr:SHOCT domain-containing protein [Acholeplasmataceae bacterium]
MGPYWGSHWDGLGPFMMLPMFLFWLLIIVIGILLVRKLWWENSDNQVSKVSKTALEILKERYAKGEISKEEFEQMKKDIQ